MENITFLVVKDAAGKSKETEKVSLFSGGSAILLSESVFRSAMGAAQKVLDKKDPKIDSLFDRKSVK